MKLSIIIPYYNKEPYIHELVDCLKPQLNKNVEVIIVDDGSDVELKIDAPHIKVIRKENGGVSSARNVGIANSTGEYISFIDADDLVSDSYVKDIISRMPFDYLDMSWKSLPGGDQFSVKLNTEDDRLKNPSACTRAFSREFIGDVRFNENKEGAEDEEFTRKLHLEKGKCAVITDYSYFYRTYVENSATKKYMTGGLRTKRIVYHFNHITKDMTYLIDEIRKEDEHNEVVVMTNQNDIPELAQYARIQSPANIRGMELRGEDTPLFKKIPTPFRTQIVIWTDTTYAMGGIETFIYNFCYHMSKYYDITVMYKVIDDKQLARLTEIVQTLKYNYRVPVVCDTLIVNRIQETVPDTIMYSRKIQMCHTCKLYDKWYVPEDNDKIIFVSEVAKDSFKQSGDIINNLTYKGDVYKPLILLSATRLNTFEKGGNRMVEFAKLLKNNGINFLWFIFSETVINNAVDGMIFLKPTLDIQGYMQIADYVVQLSDVEAFCYTIVEALQLGIPVLTTQLDVLSEIGFEDGENGYILPNNMQFVDIEEIAARKLKGFKYKYDNKKRIDQWRKLLGNKKTVRSTKVRVIQPYFDVLRQEDMLAGRELMMLSDRAKELKEKGFVK